MLLPVSSVDAMRRCRGVRPVCHDAGQRSTAPGGIWPERGRFIMSHSDHAHPASEREQAIGILLALLEEIPDADSAAPLRAAQDLLRQAADPEKPETARQFGFLAAGQNVAEYAATSEAGAPAANSWIEVWTSMGGDLNDPNVTALDPYVEELSPEPPIS